MSMEAKDIKNMSDMERYVEGSMILPMFRDEIGIIN